MTLGKNLWCENVLNSKSDGCYQDSIQNVSWNDTVNLIIWTVPKSKHYLEKSNSISQCANLLKSTYQIGPTFERVHWMHFHTKSVKVKVAWFLSCDLQYIFHQSHAGLCQVAFMVLRLSHFSRYWWLSL